MRQKLSANAHKSAQAKFDQRIIIDRVVELYDELIKRCKEIKKD